MTDGTVNVSGGALTLTNGGITLATNTGTYAGGTAHFRNDRSTLNITGGTVTVGGDIINGTATSPGTSTSTLTLNGATAVLDLNGNRIGGTVAGASIDNLNLQVGTLRNVLEINNGAGLTKNTAGTLTLGGTNSYNGATTVVAARCTLLRRIDWRRIGRHGQHYRYPGGGWYRQRQHSVSTAVPSAAAMVGCGTLTVGGDVTFNTNARQDFRITAAGTPAAENTGGKLDRDQQQRRQRRGRTAHHESRPTSRPIHFTVDGTGATFTSGQTYSYRVGTIVNNSRAWVRSPSTTRPSSPPSGSANRFSSRWWRLVPPTRRSTSTSPPFPSRPRCSASRPGCWEQAGTSAAESSGGPDRPTSQEISRGERSPLFRFLNPGTIARYVLDPSQGVPPPEI